MSGSRLSLSSSSLPEDGFREGDGGERREVVAEHPHAMAALCVLRRAYFLRLLSLLVLGWLCFPSGCFSRPIQYSGVPPSLSLSLSLNVHFPATPAGASSSVGLISLAG